MCDWFQEHALDWLANRNKDGEKSQKNLLMCIPREFGKTVLITKAGLLWLQLRDPELSAYIGSETKDRAIKFLNPIKEILSGADSFQRFTMFYGKWFAKDRLWTQEALVHACRTGLARSEPSIGVWGVETGLTGAHPDIICLDDPISYERMESHSGWIEVVNRHIASLIPVLKGNGMRIFIGTRYADGDMIGRALRLHGARTITGMQPDDARARPDGLWHVYFLSARERTADRTPTFPEQWPHDRLMELEKEEPLKYYAQMENNPTNEEVVPLTRRQVDQLWVKPADVPTNLRISVHIDTAFKNPNRSARGDYSVIAVWGHARDGSGDVYYLEGYGSNSWRAEQFNNKLVIVLQSLKSRGKWPYILTDESEIGKEGAWELTLQNWCHMAHLPAPYVETLNRSGKQKVGRIITAASFWVDGKVKLVENAPGVENLVDQMLKIGLSQYDDWADACADVFHPKVYKPMILPFADDQTAPHRPYDAQLQDGTLSIMGQVRAWRAEQRSLGEYMPPIGD